MTREEAIVLLECSATEAVGVLAATTEPSATKQLQRYIDAYDMAIAALREQSRPDCKQLQVTESLQRNGFGDFEEPAASKNQVKGIRLMSRPWQPQDLLDDLQLMIDEEPDRYLNDRRTTLCMARDFLKEHFAEDGKKVTTNADRIRAMSDEELGRFCIMLADDGWPFACHNKPECDPAPQNSSDCNECFMNWLRHPAKEEPTHDQA